MLEDRLLKVLKEKGIINDLDKDYINGQISLIDRNSMRKNQKCQDCKYLYNEFDLCKDCIHKSKWTPYNN